MTLKDLIDQTDKRKSKITLYKVYNIQSGDVPILDKPLEVDTGLDVFGITPEGALEYLLKNNSVITEKMLDDVGKKFTELVYDGLSNLYNNQPFSVTQDEEDKDQFQVQFKELWIDGHGDTYRQYIYVVEFTFPITELERYPACYDAAHNLLPEDKIPETNKNQIALTLLDRQYEMGVHIYLLKSFHIKNGEKKITVKNIEMEEISPVPKK